MSLCWDKTCPHRDRTFSVSQEDTSVDNGMTLMYSTNTSFWDHCPLMYRCPSLRKVMSSVGTRDMSCPHKGKLCPSVGTRHVPVLSSPTLDTDSVQRQTHMDLAPFSISRTFITVYTHVHPCWTQLWDRDKRHVLST
jgi:hypothetical protein